MQFTTTAAYPESYNQPINSSRTTHGSAIRTGDGGVSLVRDFKASGRVLALICQKPLERPPARIEHGFGHPCFDELLSAHVTDDNMLIGRPSAEKIHARHLPGSVRSCDGCAWLGAYGHGAGRGKLLGIATRPATGRLARSELSRSIAEIPGRHRTKKRPGTRLRLSSARSE